MSTYITFDNEPTTSNTMPCRTSSNIFCQSLQISIHCPDHTTPFVVHISGSELEDVIEKTSLLALSMVEKRLQDQGKN